MCSACSIVVIETDKEGFEVSIVEPKEPIWNTHGTIIGQIKCPECGVGEEVKNEPA
tara:strand:+ start:116 stop:283 length:168 start_codon:yes stop_codon:yes gene_type:complete